MGSATSADFDPPRYSIKIERFAMAVQRKILCRHAGRAWCMKLLQQIRERSPQEGTAKKLPGTEFEPC